MVINCEGLDAIFAGGQPLVSWLRSSFDSSVGVLGESAGIPVMHGRVLRPGPAAELRAAVVVEGLLQLGARVHHEQSGLRDGLSDRVALQEQMSCPASEAAGPNSKPPRGHDRS